MKLFHLFVLKMTTHFHVGGALWESDYSAQAWTVPLTDRLFLRRPEKKLEETLSSMRLISGTLHSTPLPWLPVLSNIELPAL